MPEIPLLVVCGPTASGKTALAVELALQLGGEVVSADSMQVYRGMDIGTAKPTPGEMRGVPHHLLDILQPGERFSVARFVQLAGAAIARIHSAGKLAVLCGGTGLYIDSLTRNTVFAEIPEDFHLREQLRGQAQEAGPVAVWQRLNRCDPALAAGLHPNNLGRVIRGIEVFETTGTPLSEWQRRSREAPSPYRTCLLGLAFRQRDTLYRRIDARVDAMLAQGLLEEAEALFDRGLGGTAAQAIGYKELFAHLRGEMPLDEAVELLKRETRRYAKRQLTWLRRDERVHWLYGEDYDTGRLLWEHAVRIARGWLEGEGTQWDG